MKTTIILSFALLGMVKLSNSQTNIFPTSGNVGIGTTTPLNKIHVTEASETEFYGTDNQAPISNLVL